MPRSSLIFLPVLLFPLSLLAAPETVKVDVLQTKLDHPRSLAFLPDNKGLLITLKDGQLKHWQAGKGLSDPIVGVPKVWASGRGGLLDVALAPDFAQSRRVWLSFAEAGNDGKAGTAVGYGRLSDDLSRIEGFGGVPTDAEALYRQPLWRTAGVRRQRPSLYWPGETTSARRRRIWTSFRARWCA